MLIIIVPPLFVEFRPNLRLDLATLLYYYYTSGAVG